MDVTERYFAKRRLCGVGRAAGSLAISPTVQFSFDTPVYSDGHTDRWAEDLRALGWMNACEVGVSNLTGVECGTRVRQGPLASTWSATRWRVDAEAPSRPRRRLSRPETACRVRTSGCDRRSETERRLAQCLSEVQWDSFVREEGGICRPLRDQHPIDGGDGWRRL